MSDNPFDVFAADFKAAIPTTDDKSNQNEQPINIMAAPSPAPVPVMNAPAAPVMNQQQPQPPVSAAQPTAGGGAMNNMNPMAMNGGGMGMMGGLTPQYGMNGGGMGMGAGMGAGMGMPPPSQQQPPSLGGAPPTMMNGGMGGGMMGMGGGMQQPPAPGAMVPSAQPSNPYAMSMNMGLQQQQYQQPPAMGGMGMGLSMNQPPAAPPAVQTPAPPTGGSVAPDVGAAPTTTAAPPESAPAAPPTQPPPPFGQPAPPTAAAAATADPFGGQPAPPVPPSADPFGQSAPPVPPTTEAADPWAQPAPSTTQPPPAPVPAANDAIVPVPNGAVNDDPFGVFTQGPPPAAAAADVLSVATPNPAHNYTSEQVQAAADDPWNSTPFGSSSPSNNNAAPAAPSTTGGGGLLGDDSLVPAGGGAPAPTDDHKAGELPPGGEWYDARIFTPTLGVMFFKPQELTDSLFLQTERSLVNALDDRPVVAFIVEGSSARAAGVELGHVLLKVNGIDVKNPKEASRLIKEGPRPLPLLFYVPDTNVVVAEGEHMVKYDTRDTTAPNSAKDWKPKYVVIGGIIAQPWMMNMYRSKSEYDIAVIETQARRPVSVKVKQFSLQGARIQNDWQGPQMVKYKNKLHPWKYIVILPISRNPIKISSPNLAQLKPVHEGIRRVLMAQQRHAPSPSRGDPYGGGGHGQRDAGAYHGGHGAPPQQSYNQGPPPPQHYAQPPSHYGGPPPQQQQPQQGYGGYGNDYSNQAGGMGSARRRSEY